MSWTSIHWTKLDAAFSIMTSFDMTLFIIFTIICSVVFDQKVYSFCFYHLLKHYFVRYFCFNTTVCWTTQSLSATLKFSKTFSKTMINLDTAHWSQIPKHRIFSNKQKCLELKLRNLSQFLTATRTWSFCHAIAVGLLPE